MADDAGRRIVLAEADFAIAPFDGDAIRTPDRKLFLRMLSDEVADCVGCYR